MQSIYLLCFGVGLFLCLLAVVSGSGHLHLGHIHFGHMHVGRHGPAHGLLAAINGFTIPAFLCWFGGTGYLMLKAGVFPAILSLIFSTLSGLGGASLLYGILFKVLVPRERVLHPEDTEMAGVLARVSDQIRPGGTGEILFTQTGARRSAAARSEDGQPIPRDAEVLVLRYERGIAYVRPFDEGDQFGESRHWADPLPNPSQPSLPR